MAGCTPQTPGTVSAASIGSTSDSNGPGPNSFEAPDSATCCSSASLLIAVMAPHTAGQPAIGIASLSCLELCQTPVISSPGNAF